MVARSHAGPTVFLVAGEASGDALGAGLMRELRAIRGDVAFRGIGGEKMAKEGLASLFDIGDISAIGIAPIIGKLPTILRRLREVVAAVLADPPDILVLIDAPDFTHRVAHRVRKRLPHLPIVKYVSPTVWVWRPGRARAMRPYVDLILALLPFEPEVHRRLGGPACVYVGHPALEHLDDLRPPAREPPRRDHGPPLILALPGSRVQEIRRLAPVFGQALDILAARREAFDVVLPTLPHLAEEVAAATKSWRKPPQVVTGDAQKFAAFRRARAAIAASGTVTLELALAGIPQVTAYRIAVWEGWLLRMLTLVDTPILPNLILGENVVPQYLQFRCTGENLARALGEILDDGPARARQIEAFRRLDPILKVGDASPSRRAASAVLGVLARG
jgi:lipid-A-disaccharide synthase